jgi:hypothetical protein
MVPTTAFQWAVKGLVRTGVFHVCQKKVYHFCKDVNALREASGNDIQFERALLDAYRDTCCPHLESLPALLKARPSVRVSLQYLLTWLVQTKGT